MLHLTLQLLMVLLALRVRWTYYLEEEKGRRTPRKAAAAESRDQLSDDDGATDKGDKQVGGGASQ
jgi:hypothetical protein